MLLFITFYSFIFVYGHACATTYVLKSEDLWESDVSSHPRIQGWNLRHQAWQQVVSMVGRSQKLSAHAFSHKYEV